MKSLRVQDHVMSEINITPFTDVLLVLLTIFMILAALLTPPGFQKSLPNNCNCIVHPAPVSKSIELLITRSGKMFLGRSPVDKNTLYAALGRAAASEKHPSLRISADSKSHYALVIRALDAAKLARVDDVILVTE